MPMDKIKDVMEWRGEGSLVVDLDCFLCIAVAGSLIRLHIIQ